MKVKLAELLLKRKELEQKVKQLQQINQDGLFEVKVTRQPISDNIDHAVSRLPLISMKQVAHAFDTHAKNLRLVDAAIQQANWATEVDIDESTMADYVDPYVTDVK